MFEFHVTTAADTTKADPAVRELQLRRGVIDRVEVGFPPGCVALLHVAIYRGGALLWPENTDDGFSWDDYTLAFNPFYRLDNEPTTLQVRTWNEDDTYSHEAVIRINVAPTEVYFPDRPEPGLLRGIADALGGRRRR